MVTYDDIRFVEECNMVDVIVKGRVTMMKVLKLVLLKENLYNSY
jgi:hypothetical protein